MPVNDSSKQASSTHNHETADQGSIYLPLVAIVILNWNGRNYLQQFLPSVVATTYSNTKIVVADNASTDDSVSFLEKEYPQVQLIHNGANLGFAKGYNVALKQVHADYFVLLNSDVAVTPGWLEPMVSLMESDARIGACQPKILSYERPTEFEYAGACGGWVDKFGYPFARGRVFDVCETDLGQYDQAAPCFWATGAALMVRSSLYHKVGGLDEFFFAHQEEIDFCWRMQMMGYTVFCQPAAVVYHVGGGTLPKGNSLKTFLNFRNNLVMIYKNTNRPAVFPLIVTRLVLDAVAAWKALLGGDGGYFISVAKAHIHFLGWMLFKQGKSVFPQERKEVNAGRYHGSVVWQYFVRSKKTFQEIIGNK